MRWAAILDFRVQKIFPEDFNLFYRIPRPQKHTSGHPDQVSWTNNRSYGQLSNFVMRWAAILDMAYRKISHKILTCFIGFLDPQNIQVDTLIKSLGQI